jgi:NADH dehydrogenase
LLNLAKKNGIPRFVFISSQSVRISAPSVYGATKKEAEELVLQSPEAFVVRPPIIYGPGAGGLFSKFAGLVRKAPVIPVPSAPVRFRPIFVDDVVEVIIKCLELPSNAPRLFDIAGPDAVTLPELIKAIARELGKSRIIVPIPLDLLLVAAKGLELVMKNPPITTSNLIGMKEETKIDVSLAERTLGFKARSLRQGLHEMFAAG